MQSDLGKTRRWLWVGVFLAVWTFMAVLYGIDSYVAQLWYDKPIAWSLALRRAFKDWYTCGFLSLGVFWFCAQNRFDPKSVPAWIARHFLGAVLFFAAYVTITSWLLSGERSVQTGEILTFQSVVKKLAVHEIVMCLIMYWFLVFAHVGWDYYKRFREREVEAAELQAELVQAKLNALRMQLNPHFLFNTLHAVSALMHENPDAADRVLARLSELLRLSLDQSKPQEVPLSEEMAFLDSYLEIEQTRFADRLTIEKRVDPDARRALVPYLILQPLVENAIRHGIEPREEQGRVNISAQRTDGKLQLAVRDNGNGLASGGTEGIGLSNTRSRLRHLYGDNYKFELASPDGGGLEARIEIPYRTGTAPEG